MKTDDARAAMVAALRVLQGEDAEVVAAETGLDVDELLRSSARLATLLRKESEKDARKAALEATREAIVEDRVRRHLTAQGYSVTARHSPTGPDVMAAKDGRTLLVEVKGDRPGHVDNSAAINVDVATLLGQIVMAKGQGLADDYAVAIRPVHMRLLEKAIPVLQDLGVKVLVVEDDGIRTIEGKT